MYVELTKHGGLKIWINPTWIKIIEETEEGTTIRIAKIARKIIVQEDPQTVITQSKIAYQKEYSDPFTKEDAENLKNRLYPNEK